MIRRIAILVHLHDTFEETAYFVREFAKLWREKGIETRVLRNPALHVEADLAILHLDLTVIPPEYLALARRYPVCVNGRVADISKRLVSTAILQPGDPYSGPAIVKTNRNSQGAKESELARKDRPRASTEPSPLAYRVYDSADAVPDEVWTDRRLVVERFCPERKGDLYAMRTWMFFGQRESGSIVYSPEPVVKSDSVVEKVPLDDVPEALRWLREDLAFDFGTFNYTLHEGEPVLFDANRTPTLGQRYTGEPTPSVFHFAEGIFDFDPESPPSYVH